MPAPRFRFFRFAPAALIAAALTACGPEAPPPVVAAPPPPVVVTPPSRPLPPGGAMTAMAIPTMRPDGLRQTVNRDLTEQETLWHFRSGLNVAALNCLGPTHARIADDYNLFLQVHRRELDKVNKSIDQAYRRQYGSGGPRARDTHTTQVYNFFALPPVMSDFCDTALVLGQEATQIPSADLIGFASRALPQMENVFDRFYLAYEQYQRDLAQWIALYAPEQLEPSSASGTPTTTYGPTSPTTSGTSGN